MDTALVVIEKRSPRTLPASLPTCNLIFPILPARRGRYKLLLLLVLVIFCLAGCRRETVQPVSNIVLITIDTLRADALSVYGRPERTPFFDQFAQKAVVFERAFTSAPITLPAHTSLMTALYPPAHGVRNNGTFTAAAGLKTLAEYAKEHGYLTGAVIGGFPLAARFGLNQGFDFYDDDFPETAPTPGTYLYAEKSASAVRESGQQWLDSHNNGRNQPFFLWLHFFDPHHPYLKHTNSNLSPYLQEVLYVDQQLQLFFDFLKTRRLIENCLVILTSDHGEAFGEHGEISHSLFVYNTTVRIPLLISSPGIKPGRTNSVVRIVDIMPTILELAGWGQVNGDGTSLVPLLHRRKLPARSAYAETLAPALDFGWSPLFSIQNSGIKYVQAPRSEMYDLTQDPGETKNIIGKRDSSSFEKQITNVRGNTVRATTRNLSVEEREKLESLGYVSGGSVVPKGTLADPKDRIEIAQKIAALAAATADLRVKAEEYAAIAKLEPSNPLLLLRFAEIQLKLRRYTEAEKLFRRVLDLGHRTAAAYNGLAATYFYHKRMNEAESVLIEAERNGAADGETYYNRAEFLFDQGHREQAIKYYERSMIFGFAPAFFQSARIAALTGNIERAVTLLKEAERQFPEDERVNAELGTLYFRNSQYSDCLQQFQLALQKNPREVWLYYNMAMAQLRLGERSAAADSLQKFIQNATPEMEPQRQEAERLLKELKLH